MRSGAYCAAIIATPCTSFAVARGNDRAGAAPFGLRTFEHESGPPDASEVVKAFVRMRDARTPDQGGQTRNEHPYVYGFRQLGFVNRICCARFVAG